MGGNLETIGADQAAAILAKPAAFARLALGLELYPWAERILEDLEPTGARVAARCNNGSGKTSRVLVAAVLWHMSVYPKSKTICTAGVWRQVTHQLWPNLRAMAPRLPGWEILENELRAPNGSSAFGFSTDDPGKFEGWHGDEKEPLLIIIDEAKSVPDPIFEAIERCQPQRILAVSSTGLREGFFYRAFTDQQDEWKTHTVTAFDCPHLGQSWIDGMIRRWGKDHPLVQSAVFSHFVDTEDGVIPIIPAENLERLYKQIPYHHKGPGVAFVDFGAGTNETVLAYRNGNRVAIEAAFSHPDTMATVGQLIRHFRRLRLDPPDIYGDEGGIGQVMCDRLAELGWRIRRVNNDGKARDPEAFTNLGAEIWHSGARQIEQCEVILPDDPIMRAQMSARRMVFDSRGRLGAESKKDMRKRGVESPDRADAVLGALWARPSVAHDKAGHDAAPSQNWEQAPRMAGAFAGV